METPKDVQICPPWEKAPRIVYFVLKDVLLDKQVFWKLDSTTVFGFGWTDNVHAVIPWEKLGLSLEQRRGKLSIVGSEVSRLRAEEVEEEENPNAYGPALPILIDIPKHKFVLAYSKEKDQWCFTLPEDSLLLVEHMPFGERQYHSCGSTFKKTTCRNFCGLKHGDYIRIGWAIHPSEGHKPEELVFVFYDHDDYDVEEPKGTTLLMMPDTVLPKILSTLTPREFLNGIGLTAPEINTTLRGNMPWKKLFLRYTLNGLRIAKTASAASVTSITFKTAPATGPRSAAPDPPEFVEKFHRLLVGTNLVSLYIWDTRLLHKAPTPPNLKSLNLCQFRGPGTLKERMGCLENSPIERVQISAVEGMRGRDLFELLPKATKLHFAFYPQREFWRTSTKAQVSNVTHLCIELSGNFSSVSSECPILLMHNLQYLRIYERKPLLTQQIRFGVHEQLKTMAFSILCIDERAIDGDFWNRVNRAAPNLENLWIVSDEINDMCITRIRSTLKNLKRVVIQQASVSMTAIRDMMRDLPYLEYLKVESRKIPNNELAREEFLAHVPFDSTMNWIWIPHPSPYEVHYFDLKFFYTKLPSNEAEKAEGVFKF